MKKKQMIATILGSLMLLGACAGEQKKAETDYEIKMGYYNCDHMIAGPVGEAAGIYKDHGLNVKLTGGGKVPEAMAAAQMDAGLVGSGNIFSAVGKGSPVVIAANNHTGGSEYLVVANDINSPEEIYGKRFATSQPSKNSLLLYMQQVGLSTEDDKYEIVNIGADADKFLALRQGEISAYTTCDPWGTMAEYNGVGKIMDTYAKMDGETGICCGFTMHKNFIKDHEETAIKLMHAYVDANKYCYEHPIKTAEIFSQYYSVPAEVGLITMYNKCVKEGRTLSWKLDPDRIQHAHDVFEKYGRIDVMPKIEDVYNYEFYEKAKLDDFDEFIKTKVDPVFPQGMTYEEFKAKAEEIDGPLSEA